MMRDTLAFRTLLAIAHQRHGLDERRCRSVLEFLSTAAAVRAALRRELADFELTDLSMAVLVVLFALDPDPSTPADLAEHTGATRSAMTEVIDRLETRTLVLRQRDTRDRRMIYIHLTETGRTLADKALVRFLEASARVAQHLEASAGDALLGACDRLNRGLA
ncbi:MarR family transcriptional regulator [Opitutus sp. ER46]|uniref:MarR family winged helix-turn-helix transcriptional regulator n=1 Tax=Opitutus sp. ER46 TaxID=2161864 RepID=UPI001304C26A|nr:MarR family transcriptional regulator [Opitutus sp. ER46]